ncbi:MAG: NADH-quinone oxidoreductase subunit F, partial [Lentisphaerae bacterium]|nr:NADH-quinone oxidoreductase subunit F [Lentisphaerota bacterium]
MNTIKELNQMKDDAVKGFEVSDGIRVVVGMATCGISAGAKPVLEKFIEEAAAAGIKDVKIVPTGCIGMCIYEPIVEVFEPGKKKVTYIHMDADRVSKVVSEHLVKGKPVVEYTIGEGEGNELKNLDDVQFYKKQKRIVLSNCGLINPEDINDYVALDGYQALAKVLTTMTPKEVIDLMKASGLRGRGGAGFSTGMKWSFAAANEADQKYIVCNADEGDPGAFMDRSVLEGDPHSILEAMTIGGYAIGATKGFIYVRAEYPVAVHRLQIAIAQAKEKGLLGKNIFDSGFDFDIEIRLGAGAFVCGEETALIASIEGKRGMSRNKPPFPANKGLWGKPTIINNVETLANIPKILLNGPEWFKSMGTEKSPGTKVFALGGKINNTGLVEVPMGITLREVIYDIGEDCLDGKAFKAVQTGGPSGGCITTHNLDTPIDFDNLVAIGSMMGSGGMIVMDEDNCMV